MKSISPGAYFPNFTVFYDFTDASNYKLTLGASGITFTGINPNLTFPQRTISNVEANGLRFQRQALALTLSRSPNFTLCVVMQLWLNRRFMIEFQVKNYIDGPRLRYDTTSKRLFLIINSGETPITLLKSFNNKKVVIWMTENSNAGITKVAISNYASTLIQQSNAMSSGRKNLKNIIRRYSDPYNNIFSKLLRPRSHCSIIK